MVECHWIVFYFYNFSDKKRIVLVVQETKHVLNFEITTESHAFYNGSWVKFVNIYLESSLKVSYINNLFQDQLASDDLWFRQLI